MKNICYFLVSMVITILAIYTIKYVMGEKNETNQEYELHTCVSVSSNNENIKKNGILKYKDYCDKDGNIELEINVEKYDARMERFEIIVLKNLKQEKFQLTKSRENMESYQFEIENDEQKKKVGIILKKEQISNKNNIVIILRQDIDVYSSDNEMVSASNTVCIPFCIIREKSRSINELEANEINASKIKKDDTESLFKVSILNTENKKLLQVKPREEVKFYVELPSEQDSKNIVLWCLLNSKQIKIEDEDYLTVNMQADYCNKILISFVAPEKTGKYEMELFGQFVELKSNKINKFYSIISANRYTLEVKE